MKSSPQIELYCYVYAFNNPLNYTDPSGWQNAYVHKDPREDYEEDKGPAFTQAGEVHWVLPGWYNGPSDPYAGMGFDMGCRLGRASVRGSTYRPKEAGPGFEHYYTYIEGTEGGSYVRNSDFVSTSNPKEITYLWKYVDRTILNPPKNYFTDYYSDQDNWDYSLTAFAGDENRDQVARSISADFTIAFGPIGILGYGRESTFVKTAYPYKTGYKENKYV